MSRTLRTSAAALLLISLSTLGCGDDSARRATESVPPGSVDATSTSAATSTSTTAPGPVTITPTVDHDVPQHTIVIPLASLDEGKAAAQPNGCDCVEDHSGTGGIVALADGRIALLREGDTTVHLVDSAGGLSTLITLPEGAYAGLVASPDATTVLAIDTAFGHGIDLLDGSTYDLSGIVTSLPGGQGFALDEQLVLYVRSPGYGRMYPLTQFSQGTVVSPSGTIALDASWLTVSASDRLIVHRAGTGAEVTIDLGEHEWVNVLSSATLDDGRLVSIISTPVNGYNTFSLLIVDGDEATLAPFDFDPTNWNVALSMAAPMAVHGSSITVAGYYWYGGGVTLTTFDL